jgi:hypothetical protein
MQEKIWYEMLHFKHGERYLCYLTDRQRTVRKWMKIGTLVFSGSGILGWKFWDIFPLIFSSLTAVIQLVTLVENSIVVSESETDKIGDLRLKYIQHFHDLEQLWMAYYEREELSETHAAERFHALRIARREIDAQENKLDVKEYAGLRDKAEKDTNEYIQLYHSISHEPNQ